MPSISESGQQAIKDVLDASTRPEAGLQGLVFCAIDIAGNYLTQQCSGVCGLTNSPTANRGSPPASNPTTLQTVFWLASCTKMITGIAVMQLVEQGKLDLESPELLYKVCPELREKKVLEDNGQLVPKKQEINMRMLLDHTAGFSYSFLSEKLRDWARPIGVDELDGDLQQILDIPLVNQPGTRWQYGLNIDWAGIAVERASGMTLDDYFQRNIFEPLGIKNMGFFLNDDMRKNLITMAFRSPDGKTQDMDHFYRLPIGASPEFRKAIFQTGGAGCYGTPSEYCQILAMLLNNGTSPTTKAKVLSPASIDMMMTNSIPRMPDFGRNPVVPCKPGYVNAGPELYPQPGNPPQGWGLTFMKTIEPGPTGRGANTIHWTGIANCFWWADREKGVAGMLCGQIMPFGDEVALGAWIGVEKALYDHLI